MCWTSYHGLVHVVLESILRREGCQKVIHIYKVDRVLTDKTTRRNVRLDIISSCPENNLFGVHASENEWISYIFLSFFSLFGAVILSLISVSFQNVISNYKFCTVLSFFVLSLSNCRLYASQQPAIWRKHLEICILHHDQCHYKLNCECYFQT